MKKRIFSTWLLCCILLSVFSLPVFAAQKDPILPQWTNTSVLTATLDFSGTTGYVDVSVTGQSGVSNISAEIKLYYKAATGAWIEYPQGWTYSEDSAILVVGETFTGLPGCEYKIELTAYVTKNGYTETVTKTSTDTCPFPY